MKLHKYYPNYCEGFPDIECDVSTLRELLDCEICKPWVDSGYKITVKSGVQEDQTGMLIAIKEDHSLYKACTWNVIAINIEPEDVDILYEWLPEFVKYKQECFVRKYGHTSEELRSFGSDGFAWHNKRIQEKYENEQTDDNV